MDLAFHLSFMSMFHSINRMQKLKRVALHTLTRVDFVRLKTHETKAQEAYPLLSNDMLQDIV